MENIDPTDSQQIALSAVNCVYDGNHDDLSVSASKLNLPKWTGKVSMETIEQLPEAAVVLRQQSGRYNALQMLFYNFRRFRKMGGDLDEWAFQLLVEDWESRKILFTVDDSGKGNFRFPDAVLFRGCAFFEHYFDMRFNWEEYVDGEKPSFAKLINIAAYRNVSVIDQTEQKMFHLVREVRNDVAHHAWLTRYYSFDAVVHAARVQLYLIGEFLRRYAPDIGFEINPNWDEIDPEEEYLAPIHEMFGWEYNSDRKYWETSGIDETPPL